MSDQDTKYQWQTLDSDLNRISRVEAATNYAAKPLVGVGISLVFVALAALAAAILTGGQPGGLIVVVAAAFGAYMALNIGANDVANNMGPAVGANALTMGGALIIAAICEVAGALLAGGDVVDTISKGIVDPATLADTETFVWAMLSALFAGAVWVNIATYLGAPVSTTHAIVGGVMGAGIIAAGMGAVNWGAMGAIAASWVISPVLGGFFAAVMLAFIKAVIVNKDDKIAAAKIWVPVLIGVMSATFTVYLAMKGFSNIWDTSLGGAIALGGALGLLFGGLSVPLVRKQSIGLENRKKSLKVLFRLPLVLSAALLSFAHGANDVANAVGPLAAIVSVTAGGGVDAAVSVPFWVMLIGAMGLSVGLVLFGPKLIAMVGDQITKLNAMRAYCVALSAAITVIAASWFGMPVSSTHIAIGGIFGVGFYREWDEARRARRAQAARIPSAMPVEENSRRKLVRRSHFMTIIAAWLITVPATAALSAACFFLLRAAF